MKSFFKSVLATITGLVIFLLLIFFVFAIIAASTDSAPVISSKSTLHIKLNGPVKEKAETPDQFEMIFDKNLNPDLGQIVNAIQRAKKDTKIKGIYFQPVLPEMGYASATILRNALKDFRSSGKYVYSYSEFYTPLTYYISSVADSIFLSPNGIVQKTGFSASIPFFKEFYDNIGIKWNIFYAGQFKSATEPLRYNKMSEQNRFQLHEFFSGLYKNTRDSILSIRNINKDSMESFVNNFKGLFPQNAVKYGLVDSLIYQIDFVNLLKEKNGISKKKKLKLVSVNKYRRGSDKLKIKKSKNKIAVIYMEGNIVDVGNKSGRISPEKFAKAFDDILRKDNIKGVVLRVNSPGGSGSASDEILRAVDRVKEAGKPVIVSMGDYAASGGYYISCHADTIVADANSLTGSIGVFGILPEFKELMDDKLKVHFDSVKTHKMSLAFSPQYNMDDDSRKLMQTYIENFYEQFLLTVAKGRNMTRDQVHKVAQGRIWLGAKAQEIGLVDVLGNLDKAIEICANKANLEEYTLTKYPRVTTNFVEQIIMQLSEQTNVDSKILNSKYIKEFKPVLEILNDKTQIAQPQARLPFDINFR
jgi:protease-4